MKGKFKVLRLITAILYSISIICFIATFFAEYILIKTLGYTCLGIASLLLLIISILSAIAIHQNK